VVPNTIIYNKTLESSKRRQENFDRIIEPKVLQNIILICSVGHHEICYIDNQFNCSFILKLFRTQSFTRKHHVAESNKMIHHNFDFIIKLTVKCIIISLHYLGCHDATMIGNRIIFENLSVSEHNRS
jgi:hypothetical protein